MAMLTGLLLVRGCAFAEVGVISTLQGELDELLKHTRIEQRIHIAGRDFYRGVLEGERIVLVRSPMGKVNGAITAQVLVCRFDIEIIVSLGFAGAVDESLKVGDVIVSRSAVQHDSGVIEPYGFVWEGEAAVHKTRADGLEAWAESRGYSRGTIASGDQFVASEEKREWIRAKFGAVAVDMGSAAIEEVCSQNGIGFFLIRVISDRADSQARSHFAQAARSGSYKSVEVAREFLRHFNHSGRSK